MRFKAFYYDTDRVLHELAFDAQDHHDGISDRDNAVLTFHNWTPGLRQLVRLEDAKTGEAWGLLDG